MKIPLLVTGALAALLAVTPLQRALPQDDNAASGDVSFDLFYNNLADDGDWYNTPEYGYVWQPFIAYKTDSWRPYSDGYWAQTDSGWTWVSYENFGWATYHYGRWTRLKDIGWAWVPGYQWGPGWVSWRTSDDYVGWAPLPPKVERGVYEGKIVDRRSPEREATIDYNDVESEDDGYTANVDQDYDIGPANYCFVGTRSFGAPVLSEVLLPPQQNVTIIEGTTNVTNIYYNREPNNVFVYNGGPNYNFIEAHSEHPIQRLQIERVQNTSYLEEGLRAGGNPTQVRGGILQVAAPVIARRPVNFAQVKPAHVKQTIEQPQVVHGWSNTGANPEAVQQLHNRFKQQAQQAPAKAAAPQERVVQPLPPAQRVVTRAPAPVPANAPGAANGLNKNMSPEAVAARRAQRQQERAGQAGQPAAQPGQPAQAGQPSPRTPGQPLSEEDRVARRNAAQQARDTRTKGQPNGQPAAATQSGQPGQPNSAANGQPKDSSPEAVAARRAQRQQQRAGQPGTPAPEQATPATRNAPEQPAQPAQSKDKSPEAVAARRAQRQQERDAQGGAKAPEAAAQPEARSAQPEAQPAAQPKDNSDEAKAARRAQRQQERAAQPQAQPAQPQQAAPQADAERESRRAERQQERAQPAEQPKANPERDNGQAQRQQAQQAQAQQAQANQEKAARQAQRQQERAAQPQAQPPQPNPQRDAKHAERQAEKNTPGDNKPNQ